MGGSERVAGIRPNGGWGRATSVGCITSGRSERVCSMRNGVAA